MKFRDRFLLAKIEATEGVDPEPDGSSAVRSMDVTWNPYEGQRQLVEDDRPGLGAFEEINTQRHIVASFMAHFSGNVIVDTPDPGTLVAPGLSPLLRACGLDEELDTDEDEVIYTPVSEDYESTALWLVRKLVLHKSFGVRGNLQINLTAGELAQFQFEQMTGSYVRPEAPPGTPIVPGNADAFPTALPFGEENTPTLTLGGLELCAQSFNFNLGNTVSYRDFANCKGAIIEDRQGSGNLVFKAPAVGTKNWFTDLESHTGVIVKLPLIIEHGTVAGRTIRIEMPMVQLRNITEQNVQGDLFYSADFAPLPEAAGDGEFKLIFK